MQQPSAPHSVAVAQCIFTNLTHLDALAIREVNWIRRALSLLTLLFYLANIEGRCSETDVLRTRRLTCQCPSLAAWSLPSKYRRSTTHRIQALANLYSVFSYLEVATRNGLFGEISQETAFGIYSAGYACADLQQHHTIWIHKSARLVTFQTE